MDVDILAVGNLNVDKRTRHNLCMYRKSLKVVAQRMYKLAGFSRFEPKMAHPSKSIVYPDLPDSGFTGLKLMSRSERDTKLLRNFKL